MRVFIDGQLHAPEAQYTVVNCYGDVPWSYHYSRARAAATLRWEHQRAWPEQTFGIRRRAA